MKLSSTLIIIVMKFRNHANVGKNLVFFNPFKRGLSCSVGISTIEAGYIELHAGLIFLSDDQIEALKKRTDVCSGYFEDGTLIVIHPFDKANKGSMELSDYDERVREFLIRIQHDSGVLGMWAQEPGLSYETYDLIAERKADLEKYRMPAFLKDDQRPIWSAAIANHLGRQFATHDQALKHGITITQKDADAREKARASLDKAAKSKSA